MDSKKKARNRNKLYRKINKRKIKTYQLEYYSNRREYMSVKGHHYRIFSDSCDRASYKGMPFFDDWNPDKGGSYKNGEQWIIKNLGRRPNSKSSLNIVNHEIGFVPGNLEWSYPREQTSNQMFRIITRLKKRVEELESALKEALTCKHQ